MISYWRRLSSYTVCGSEVKTLAHDCKQDYVTACCFVLLSFPPRQKKHHKIPPLGKKPKAKKTATWKRTRRKKQLMSQPPLQRRRKCRRRVKRRLNTHLSRIQKSKRRNQVKKRKGDLISPTVRHNFCLYCAVKSDMHKHIKQVYVTQVCLFLQKAKGLRRRRKKKSGREHLPRRKRQMPRIRPRCLMWGKVRICSFLGC